jgi:hypothetical protein
MQRWIFDVQVFRYLSDVRQVVAFMAVRRSITDGGRECGTWFRPEPN